MSYKVCGATIRENVPLPANIIQYASIKKRPPKKSADFCSFISMLFTAISKLIFVVNPSSFYPN
jgi:hypothetical protein